MAGGKETPRQRMIGILYLVLLGLIALNVPENLLDAFKNITRSLDASTQNVNTSLQATYSAFDAKIKAQPEKAKYLNAAKEATKMTDDLNSYINQLKAELTERGGGVNPEIDDITARDNLDISSDVMINGKKADVLKEKIQTTRAKLLELLGKDSVGVNFSLNADAPPIRPGMQNKTWQEAYFGEGIPLGATITTLAKIQADTKNAENEVVKKLYSKVDQAEVTLNAFNAIVAAPSNYVLAGQQYTAQIYLTAYDSHSNPTITIGGSSVPTRDGIGTYTTTASGEGKHTLTGELVVKSVDGGPDKRYPISQDYMVARPSAVVSPDKMNVLYIGVPNPVSVSAPGVPTSSLNVHMDNGSLSGSAGHYTATVSAIGHTKITVTGEKGMVLGATDFRIKRIPDPKPQFAGKSGGNTSAANIRAQDRVFAQLDGFDFDAKFNVTHFTLIIVKPRQDAIIIPGNGADISGAMRTALNTVTPGTTVIFKDIIAVGPDRSPRSLDPIVLSAN
ncbi:gliding motility-associated protein GldM [Mucilaginibacter pineti]|uniref:Gliding motility-associated protein GldM n=1 Tax=Mucilaginibacter pineti TaxID=1391627 RepID=A0A1G7CZ54_9SPHI|nr:gliding motility protein GldM [Mucilaginibacter pineti]SDE43946.1 gliding motility-associated protein GldM [Mucilaginibacter pineti]